MSDTDCVALLIELVRDRPCLYDKSCREYRDTKTVKANNWKDVATNLSSSAGVPWTGRYLDLN